MEIQAFERVKADMLEDLALRGLTGAKYQDKVNEYMQLWSYARALDEDIEKRGIYIYGAAGLEENKSLSLRIKTSQQMLAIWGALGFKEIAKNKGAVNEVEQDEL